jgi:hypothetical protein
MFKLFEVKEGKFKVLPTLNPKYIKGFIISSIVLLLISGLSGWLRIDEKQLWKIYNAIVQQFGLKHDIPIPQDVEEELESRVELEVDRAIEEYKKLEKPEPVNMKNEVILKEIEKPKYTDYQRIIIKDAIYYEKEPDGSKAQDLLGGLMGIRGVWVEDEDK